MDQSTNVNKHTEEVGQSDGSWDWFEKEIYMIVATRIDVDYLQFLNLLELFQLQEVVVKNQPRQQQ